jgi:hypothetical protein
VPTKRTDQTTDAIEAKVAKHGQKMIEIRVRFWTDEIAENKGEVIPKHAWGSGMIYIDRNESHGIVPGEGMAFNSMSEIPAVIERCLINHGVKIISSTKMKKYSLSKPPKNGA